MTIQGTLSNDAITLYAYLDHNCRGREQATTAAQIMAATGLKPRTQQTLLLELEVAGFDVATACDHAPMGTYLAQDESEVALFLHQLRERRNAHASRIAAIEARHPQLRETRTVRPPSRIEPDGRARQLQLEEAYP